MVLVMTVRPYYLELPTLELAPMMLPLVILLAVEQHMMRQK
jgi:hypothetical protein